MMMRLGAALAALMLGACATQPVLGHCELPTSLASRAQEPAALDASKPMPRPQSDGAWARDRALAANNAKHANDETDWVQGHCQ